MGNVEKVLEDTRVAILATNGFEQSELEVPRDFLRKAGAEVEIVSLQEGKIRGWREKNWGDEVTVDRALGDVSAERYAALVLPGGQMNPDILRMEPAVVAFVQAFAALGKPIAAICHGPWLLVEADLVRGRELTSYSSIRTDIANAGGNWVDQEVVVDGNLITSRKPADLTAFCAALVEELRGKASAAAE